MIYFYVALVGTLAVGTEVFFRITNLSFWQLYPFIMIIQLPLAYGIYKVVTGADQYLEVMILFPLGTMLARGLVGFFFFKEFPPLGVIIALGLVVLANVVRIALKFS